MRKRKRLQRSLMAMTLLLLLCSQILSGCGGSEKDIRGGGDSSDTAQEIEHITFVSFGFGETPDREQVMERLNEISRREIGVEATIEFVSDATYAEQLAMRLAGGDEDMDVYVLPFGASLATYALQGSAIPLDDLIEEYGKDIKSSLGHLMDFAPINGKNYYIPFNSAKVYNTTFICRKDLCDKYGIDLTKVRNYMDLGDVFAVIKENEPEINCIMKNEDAIMWYDVERQLMPTFDTLGDNIGVLTGTDGTKVVNLFETEAYARLAATMREWYLAGYIPNDTAASSEDGVQLYGEGKNFSYYCPMVLETDDEPYQHLGISANSYDTYALGLSTPVISSSNGFWSLVISPFSKYPEAAMKWINLLYSNEEMVNTLYYGVEGVHWVKNEDGTIRHADGIEAGNSGWETPFLWLVGNSALSYVYDTDHVPADNNRKQIERNDMATYSAAFGFSFVPDKVLTEYTAVNNVMTQYLRALNCGAVDPAVELPKFNQELKDAGIDIIIAEKQRQLDEWLAANK